jgi:uncharacterized repeat protein (TIGR03803 family)
MLVSFSLDGGRIPLGGLTFGADGDLYGTTYTGGVGGDGTVFDVATNGGLTMLASFANTNGARPYTAMTLGSDGNFYGTTYYGGSGNYGTVCKMTPD